MKKVNGVFEMRVKSAKGKEGIWTIDFKKVRSFSTASATLERVVKEMLIIRSSSTRAGGNRLQGSRQGQGRCHHLPLRRHLPERQSPYFSTISNCLFLQFPLSAFRRQAQRTKGELPSMHLHYSTRPARTMLTHSSLCFA